MKRRKTQSRFQSSHKSHRPVQILMALSLAMSTTACGLLESGSDLQGQGLSNAESAPFAPIVFPREPLKRVGELKTLVMMVSHSDLKEIEPEYRRPVLDCSGNG